jgi:hypothetical protein
MQRIRRGELGGKVPHEFFCSLEIGATVAQRPRSRGEQIEARQSGRGFTWAEPSGPKQIPFG